VTFQEWNADWAPLPGKAVFDRAAQQVTAISRAPGNLDLFIIGNDGGPGTTNGHAWTTFWNSASGWNADWFPLPGVRVFDRATQQVSAVSRAPGNLDLFVVGNDGHVWSTSWDESANWNADWFPLPGTATFDVNTQHVAVVSRSPGNLDLFIIGNDGGPGTTNGHVWTTFWNSVSGWNAGWFPLPGIRVFDRATQQVSAVSRAPGNLDLFVVGNDGHVWSTSWSESANWSDDWFLLPGISIFDVNTQRVTAISRAPGNLDLFIIGNDGGLGTLTWPIWICAVPVPTPGCA
jgi:hypothetical protein